MIIISKIIFWAILPIICIIFRFKKKITTSFAFFGIFTSFLLGLILTGTFQEVSSGKFINLVNQDRIEEAEKKLKYIIQKNPKDIDKIEKEKIINYEAFRRMKSKIGKEYLAIADKNLNNYVVNDNAGCNDIEKEKLKLSGLINCLRLLEMAEALGEARIHKKNKINKGIKNSKEKISRLEKKCQ